MDCILRGSLWPKYRGRRSQASRNSWVCLEVQPEDFERLKFTWFYRFFKIMNWPFSKADSVYIPSHDLDISFSELEKTIKAYAYAHNPALRDEM